MRHHVAGMNSAGMTK